MQNGEVIRTRDLAKALYNETGVFEAVSPNGIRFRVTCEPNASIASLIQPDNQGEWQITKILDAPEQQQRAKAAGQ